MTDPDMQAAADRAVAELARRLRPWATGMADPTAFATAFITAMREEGWRPPLRPPPERRPPGAGAPPDRHADELAEARKAFAAASARTRQALTREDTPHV